MGAEITRSFNEATEAGDHRRIIQLIERRWSYLMRSDDKLLQRALAEIPADVAEDHPIVFVVDELYHPMTPAVRNRGDHYITQVVETLDDLADDYLRVSVGIGAVIALKRRGRYLEASRLGRRLIEVADQAQHHPDYFDGAQLAALHLHVGLVDFLAGDLAGAERFLSVVHRQRSPWPNHAADAAGKLALVYALQGESHLARQWIRRALDPDTASSQWRFRTLERISLDAAQALLALDRLDWPEYHRHNHAPDRFIPDESWSFVLYVRARAALLLGNQRAVLDQLHQHRDEFPEHFPTGSYPRILLDTAEAELWMSLERMIEAERLISQFTGHPLEVVTTARFHLFTRQAAAAKRITEDEHWPAHTSRRDRINLLLLAAMANLRTEPANDKRTLLLRRAVAETANEQEPWLFTFVLADRDLIHLIPQYVPEAGDLINTLIKLDPMKPFAPVTPAAKLSAREQLVLEHLAQDHAISHIADTLHVSPSTIRNQRKSIYRKLGATSRQQAIEIALRAGLITSPHQQ